MPRKERLRFLIFTASLFLVLDLSARVLTAQSDRGTITGTVTDPTEAAIVGVSVTATNAGTGVTSKTNTGANGSYTIPLLPVGTYQVSAEHPGFKKFVGKGVVVEVGQTARVDIGMHLGEISETVQVQAEEPLLRP